ncbi:hypothetical protein Pmani_035586 [Petrolisthes manimaculis]|uniref:Uncharacterized protein n=1 Tax=Petrolisthes manimaculis TaxID=1843537 RepID=A0AAE1TNJ6_9EUCA|nr:hypothetical protein Pmani_035586 [Petrolisthes manimaculis]
MSLLLTTNTINILSPPPPPPTTTITTNITNVYSLPTITITITTTTYSRKASCTINAAPFTTNQQTPSTIILSSHAPDIIPLLSSLSSTPYSSTLLPVPSMQTAQHHHHHHHHPFQHLSLTPPPLPTLPMPHTAPQGPALNIAEGGNKYSETSAGYSTMTRSWPGCPSCPR